MRRAWFLRGAGASAAALGLMDGANVGSALAAGTAAPDLDLPALFKGGRPFLHLSASDGSRALAWLDTDGGGFIANSFAQRTRSPVNNGRAALPQFVPPLPPVGGDGTLPVIAPDPKDAILAGVDVQLGSSWFAGRVWTIDYRNQAITWHPDGRSITSDAINPVKLHFPTPNYPSLPVVVEGELIEMMLDTAASLVERTGSVVATSFITHERFAKWHGAHPEWSVRNIAAGIDWIEVPEVRILDVPMGAVSFTTRPGDDVFEGEHVAGKLGSNGWAFHVLMLDYVRGIAAFD
ncbi:MAG: hypothetical protein JO219_11955 [Candidatus Eremiobacteraeota bacterium]|nr:hypothetical protein [Candidatus Eremiobacteraeota bacterium]